MAELTRMEFARLRLDAHWRGIDAAYGRPITTDWRERRAMAERYFEELPDPAWVPPAAGDWLRLYYERLGWVGKWHRFSGDLAWKPAYHAVQLRAVDGVTFSASHAVTSRTLPESDVCKRCVRPSPN